MVTHFLSSTICFLLICPLKLWLYYQKVLESLMRENTIFPAFLQEGQ